MLGLYLFIHPLIHFSIICIRIIMYIYKYILCILYLAHMELIPHQVGEYGWIPHLWGEIFVELFMFGDNLLMQSMISSNLKEKNAPVENWSNCWVTVTVGWYHPNTETPSEQPTAGNINFMHIQWLKQNWANNKKLYYSSSFADRILPTRNQV